MSLGLHGNIALTEENLLTKPLDQLDFGPFTHPDPSDITYDPQWRNEMVKHLEESIKTFQERRVLVISWVLAVLFGIFGNLFASALFGEIQSSSWGFAIAFFTATCFFAGLLFWFFPPSFKHVFRIWFGKSAGEGKHKLWKKFGILDSYDKLDDFLRVYNSLMVRDRLKEHRMGLTKVTDASIADYGLETWITVRLTAKTSWFRRSIEEELWDELGPLCEAFATTILPLLWVDENSPIEQVKAFDSALLTIRFENVKAEARQQMIEAAVKPK